eukprot:7441634-Alexandrium_andersonii.AAC.1
MCIRDSPAGSCAADPSAPTLRRCPKSASAAATSADPARLSRCPTLQRAASRGRSRQDRRVWGMGARAAPA